MLLKKFRRGRTFSASCWGKLKIVPASEEAFLTGKGWYNPPHSIQRGNMAAPLDLESLKSLSLFKDLNSTELANMVPLFFEKTYTKNATLFVEGMTGEILYLIKKGSVNITKKAPGNQEIVLATLKEGEFLGEMSLIDNRPRTATARVAEESSLLVMTKKAFNTLLEKHPDVALKILLVFLRIANERLRKANESIKQI
jgi:CRP/FNR family cyclic AMP-dependent transcriptional regulator